MQMTRLTISSELRRHRLTPTGGQNGTPDEECVGILKNISASAEPGSCVLIAECLIKPSNEPDIGKLFDIEMLMGMSGKERTAEEFSALFDAAGITFTRIIPTESVVSVVEGVIA